MAGMQTIFKAEVLNEDALKAVATSMTELSLEEVGVLAYEWQLSADGAQLRVFESFTDGQACLAHMAHVAEFSPKLMECVRLQEIEVYGEPGVDFIEATKDYPMNYMKKIEGFRR